MKILTLLILLTLLPGCASQLDIKDGECSITFVEVDAKANTPLIGGVDADGWVLVQRGVCPPELIALFRSSLG